MIKITATLTNHWDLHVFDMLWKEKQNVARAEFLTVLQREQNDSQNEMNMWIAIVFQTEYALHLVSEEPSIF